MRLTVLFSGDAFRRRSRLLTVGLLVGGLLGGAPGSYADPSQPAAGSSQTAHPKPPVTPAPAPVARSERAEMWYAASYGIDQIHVRPVSSGQSIEFRYRVLDADKAALLTDRNASPSMIDQQTGTKLQVPVVEQIGSLRQTTKPQVGKQYFMLFSNPSKLVKAGRRVDLICGSIHLRGLVVE